MMELAMTMTKRRFLGHTHGRTIIGLILLLRTGAADLFSDTRILMSPFAHITYLATLAKVPLA